MIDSSSEVRKKLIELKTIISSVERRLCDFQDATGTLQEALQDAASNEFSESVQLLSKELIITCLHESKHWIRLGNVDKALQAHLAAALAFFTSKDALLPADARHLEQELFTAGIPRLWELGTYYHRQGNVNLLTGTAHYEILSSWDFALHCYQSVTKLCELANFADIRVHSTFSTQASSQMQDILCAKSKLS
jgi:hypothetical protein